MNETSSRHPVSSLVVCRKAVSIRLYPSGDVGDGQRLLNEKEDPLLSDVCGDIHLFDPDAHDHGVVSRFEEIPTTDSCLLFF